MTQGVFLYYLPGKSLDTVTVADLESNPVLSGPFFEAIHSPRMFAGVSKYGGNIVNKGPDGGAGCIIAPQPQVATNQIPGFFPDKQTWRKFGDQWIGWQNDMKPGPESLRRASQISGYEVEFGDGQVWIAPTIRPFYEEHRNWGCSLPMSIGLDEKMEHTAKVIDRFRWAWDLSAAIADVMFNGVPASQFDTFDQAARCLSLNYRIGPAESSILELFNSDTIKAVLQAAVDNELVEKMLAESGATGNPTDPPEPANISGGSLD